MMCVYRTIAILLMIGLGLSGIPPQLSAKAELLVAGRPNMGHPRRGTRRGGGSRGGVCDLPTDVPPLTALMPDSSIWDSTATEIVFSLTTRTSPDLWFYLPYSLAESSRVTFTLKAADETLKRVRLDTTQPLPVGRSIIRVSLAELELMLASGVDYHWYFTVNCEAGPTVSVDGWLNYQPDQQAPLTDQFFVDTLSTLAEAQLTNPGDDAAQAAWRETLESVGLSDITETTLTDCCSFVE